MKAIILSIGNELLNGEVTDTNSTYLQRELAFHNIDITRVSQLPDDIVTIKTEIQRAMTESNCLFITGGLGPTEDDLTREALAEALGVQLVQDMAELETLRAKFIAYGREIALNNEKQTFFPEKSSVIANPLGTASGIHCVHQQCNIYVFPGVPSELKHMLKQSVIPQLSSVNSRVTQLNKLVVKCLGIGESTLDAVIKEKILVKHPIRWEITARTEGILLKFYPTGDEQTLDWVNPLKKSLEHELGNVIYGYDSDNMDDILAKLLLNNKLTFGTVESCTGGMVSAYMTRRSGSSAYFLGSLITYSNELKEKLAFVTSEVLEQHGAVSLEVAEALVRGGKRALQVDCCVAITGIAGPTGGTEDKPVGTVCFAVIDQHSRVISKKRLISGDREEVRTKAMIYSLNLLRLILINDANTVKQML